MGLVFCSMIALVALCKYFVVAASTSGPETRGNVSCRKPRSRKKHKGRGKGAPRTKSKARPASSAQKTRRIWSLPKNLLPLPRDRRHRRIGVGGVALHVEFGLAADRQPRAGGRRGSPGRGRQRAHAQHGLAAATPSIGPPLVSTTASIVFMASPSKGLNIS